MAQEYELRDWKGEDCQESPTINNPIHGISRVLGKGRWRCDFLGSRSRPRGCLGYEGERDAKGNSREILCLLGGWSRGQGKDEFWLDSMSLRGPWDMLVENLSSRNMEK